MTSTILDAFNVTENDITADVNYVASGSLQLEIEDGATEDEVADAVATSLAELLDVHPKDIVVTSVNLETGEVEYELVTDNYADTDKKEILFVSLYLFFYF